MPETTHDPLSFKKSVDEGQVPQGLKDAHLTNLHKKGNKSNPEITDQSASILLFIFQGVSDSKPMFGY